MGPNPIRFGDILAPLAIVDRSEHATDHSEAPDVALDRDRGGKRGVLLGHAKKIEIPRVIEALGDPDADVRLAAACFLGWGGLGKRSPTLIPALGRALADSDARVREWSAKTLGYLGLDAEAALPALRALANDPETDVREQGAQAISAIEKSALTFRSTTLPQAIADLGDADPITRALAADRIGDLGSRASDAVPGLVRCLADREADVRRAAAGALGQLGPRASVAIPTLAILAESDLNEQVRRVATLSRSVLLQNDAGQSTAR
jgi:HEAT repeat protein